jgi:putative FmdB family regulatory protein
MPIYEYQCQSCKQITEAWQSISDEPLTSCPECEGQLNKLISASSFQLKGGGWYADGYSNASCAAKKETSSTPTPKKETPTTCPKKDTSCCGC